MYDIQCNKTFMNCTTRVPSMTLKSQYMSFLENYRSSIEWWVPLFHLFVYSWFVFFAWIATELAVLITNIDCRADPPAEEIQGLFLTFKNLCTI